ncbi:MAG: hypothetical protein HRT99_03765 [Mycoplasmatales bacterium]|nr:hypothetical protein [Mycoplasmatales bacterium]
MNKKNQIIYKLQHDFQEIFFIDKYFKNSNTINILYYNLEFHSLDETSKVNFLKRKNIFTNIKNDGEFTYFKYEKLQFKIINPLKNIRIDKIAIDDHNFFVYSHDISNNIQKSLVLIELDSHSKEEYHNQLKSNNFVIIDYSSKKCSISDFTSNQKRTNDNFIELSKDEGKINSYTSIMKFNNIFFNYNVKQIVLSTKLKNQFQYLKYASLMLIETFMDKPILPSNEYVNNNEDNDKLYLFFDSLLKFYKKNHSKFKIAIQAEWRQHKGYLFVEKVLKQFLKQTNLKISNIKLEYFDSNVITDDSLFNSDNNSYNYEFDKLMHSGFHVIDLFIWFLKLNGEVQQGEITSWYEGFDNLNDNYSKHVAKEFSKNTNKNLGENIFATINTIYGKAKTRASISMESMRIPLKRESSSKENEQLRYEQLKIKVGQSMTISIKIYLPSKANSWTNNNYGKSNFKHFNIDVYKNILEKGKSFESYSEKDFIPSNEANIDSNKTILHFADKEFLDYNDHSKYSDLLNHEDSIKLHFSIHNSLVNSKKREHEKNHLLIIKSLIDVFGDDYYIQGSLKLWIKN